MTDNELARRRMRELVPLAYREHASGCDDEHEVEDCPACAPNPARSELRRLGALYPSERARVARQIGKKRSRAIWPGLRAERRTA